MIHNNKAFDIIIKKTKLQFILLFAGIFIIIFSINVIKYNYYPTVYVRILSHTPMYFSDTLKVFAIGTNNNTYRFGEATNTLFYLSGERITKLSITGKDSSLNKISNIRISCNQFSKPHKNKWINLTYNKINNNILIVDPEKNRSPEFNSRFINARSYSGSFLLSLAITAILFILYLFFRFFLYNA